MADLRPIGTEFWGEPWTPGYVYVDIRLKRNLWRIVGHANNGTLETVEKVRQQYQNCTGFKFSEQGCPAHFLGRIFDGVWKDVP